MGKLLDKLQQVGQGSRAGFGFLPSTNARSQAPRPAAVVVSLGAGDSALAEAAVKAGADGVLVTGWTPGADVSKIASALRGGDAVWGVECGGDASSYSENTLKQVQEAGAAFAIVGPSSPVRPLFDEIEKFDFVIAVDPPIDEMGLVRLRAQNLLPVSAALVRAPLGIVDLAKLTVVDFAQLKLLFESLRFPALVALREAPDAASVRTLIRMGADALLLPAAGMSAEALATRVQSLREELEKTPARPDARESVAIGGLMAAGGTSLQPEKKPEREPEPQREPQREP